MVLGGTATTKKIYIHTHTHTLFWGFHFHRASDRVRLQQFHEEMVALERGLNISTLLSQSQLWMN